MYNLKVIPRENRTKFLEDRCKLIYEDASPNPKQGGSVNGTLQCRKMNKDELKDIIREVVTAIGDSYSNFYNNKTETFQKEISSIEEQIAS